MDTMPPFSLDTFIDALITEANPTTELTQEQRTTMRKDLKERLIKFINIDLLNALPDDATEGFKQLLETNATNEAMQQYITDHIPNQQEVIQNTLMNFRNTYLTA